MSKKISPKKNKLWYKIVKKIMMIFKKKVKFVYLGEKFEKGTLILCNHEGTSAPLAFELYCDSMVRFWGAEEMNSGLIRMYKYQTRVYYHEKKHWNLHLARLFCLIASPLTNMFYKGLNLISVCKNAKFIKTLKDTYTCINEYKENIVIFPEDSKNGYLEVLEGFHHGFLVLAEMCYRRQLDLPIVVSYYRKNEHICVVDKPILYSEFVKKNMSRDEIAKYLCNRCNELGQMKIDNKKC